MVGLLVCVCVSILCVGYGVLVRAIGSGTNFFIVWFLLGIMFFLLGICIKCHAWQIVTIKIRIALSAVCVIVILSFVVIECFILNGFRQKEELNLDYIIVLGAQVYDNGPSVVLQYRLDRAVTYLQENEKTICIVSGGQGYNEPASEAEIMAKYLVQNGISKDRILLETEATTTVENIALSKKLIEVKESKEDGLRVGVVTNNFHMFRAMQIARKKGLDKPCGLVAGSNPIYLPNNMLREFFGEIKYLLLHNY